MIRPGGLRGRGPERQARRLYSPGMAFESEARVRSGGVILVLSGLTLALGFAVQVALAATLGTGREMDVYLVAITLPTLLAVIALTVFPFYLVPALKACASAGREADVAILTRYITRRTALVALGLVVALEAAAGPIVHVTAPGFGADEARRAVVLLRIMLAGSFFDLLRGVLTAVEYSRERFFLPQLAPSLNHVVLFASVLLLLRPFGLVGLAAGWSVGSLVMLVAVLPALRGLRVLRAGPGPSSVVADSIRGGLLPIVVVAGLGQLSPVIDRLVASLLSAGSISYLGYGSKLLEILMRTVPLAAALSAFPVLSGHAARNDRERLGRTAVSSLRLALLGAVPLALTVLAFRVQFVQVLFQRGAFDAAATRNVAAACAWYAVAFLPATVAYLLVQVCFALKQTWFLVAAGALSVLATAALDLALARWLGFTGIALAFLFVSTIRAIAFGAHLQTRWRMFNRAEALPFAGQAGVACAAMVATWAATRTLTRSWVASHTAVWLVINAGAGAAVFIVVLWVMGNPEARGLAAAVSRKLGVGRPGAGA